MKHEKAPRNADDGVHRGQNQKDFRPALSERQSRKHAAQGGRDERRNPCEQSAENKKAFRLAEKTGAFFRRKQTQKNVNNQQNAVERERQERADFG